MRTFPPRTAVSALAILIFCIIDAPAKADMPGTKPELAMTKSKPLPSDDEKALLAPYRARINTLDSQIVTLLGQRFDVVRQVAALKAQHGIAPILPDRIEEVVHRARTQAEKSGVNPDLIEKLYRIIIETACQEEEDYARAEAARSPDAKAQ